MNNFFILFFFSILNLGKIIQREGTKKYFFLFIDKAYQRKPYSKFVNADKIKINKTSILQAWG